MAVVRLEMRFLFFSLQKLVNHAKEKDRNIPHNFGYCFFLWLWKWLNFHRSLSKGVRHFVFFFAAALPFMPYEYRPVVVGVAGTRCSSIISIWLWRSIHNISNVLGKDPWTDHYKRNESYLFPQRHLVCLCVPRISSFGGRWLPPIKSPYVSHPCRWKQTGPSR